MIPLRLELKNFMSYGEDVPALDLSGMHIICLSGENGNGKSALLDAMTWSLWGESRAGKNKHDDLVRKGADEMAVAFTFEMDGQVYRVLRKRSKRASGNQWELQQQTPDEGLGHGWRSLTGNNAGETEKAVQKLLRMSYDTFLNSAYLRQGQADQFVRQTPGKRKEILADILDLSRYDQLELKAREKAKDAGAEATDLERDIHQIDAELAREGEHRTALSELEAQRDGLQKRAEELHGELEALRDRKGQLDGQKQFMDSLRAQVIEYQKDISQLLSEEAGVRAEADGFRALLARQDEICRDFEALGEARRRLEELDEAVRQWHRGQQALAVAEKEWMAAENEVRARADRAAREHEQADLRVRDYPMLKKEHDRLAPRVAELRSLEAEQETVREQLTAAQEGFQALREENAGLDAQIAQWQERIGRLSKQQGTCEVCNAPLPPARVAQTQAEYEAALTDLQARRKAVRADAAALKEQITTHQQRAQQIETELKAVRADERRLAQLEQPLLELEETRKDLPNLAALRDETARVLAERNFAPEVRARLDKIERALAKLQGVEAEHGLVRERVQSLQGAERGHLELQHAQKSLQDVEARLARTQRQVAQRQESCAGVERQLAGLRDVEEELAQIVARGREIRQQELLCQGQEQQVHQQIGSHEEALSRIAGLKTIRGEKEKHLSSAKREQEVHDQLTKAFGKKGVQALIIENAIPELQEETNHLLERLTDGDMSLHFQTLRDARTKRDSPIETLDIQVSDSLGTRPLEMYSGGESFRAAFALRIALSKLLARRAGARLQTLIIDEGFGTQDGKGREKLVDALNAIATDFEKIIVISHIDELKDAFPTRIEVVKTPSGSQITVMEGAAG